MIFFSKSFSEFMLEHNKTYQKYTENMNDGTYRAEVLRKTSEMAKNSERYEYFTKRYINVGKVLLIITAAHLLMIIIAVFQAEFISYFFILAALLMQWYALYTKKTAFAYAAPVSAAIAVMVDVLLGFYSIMLIWGGMIFLLSIFMIAVIHSLNKEYIYLSQQEGFPYFRYILDEEIEKNKKALAGKIDLYYANLTAPEGKLGDMDDLDMPLERIEARPDGRNDLMDGI